LTINRKNYGNAVVSVTMATLYVAEERNIHRESKHRTPTTFWQSFIKKAQMSLRMHSLKGSHSFTRLSTNWMIHPVFNPSRRASPHFGRYSFRVLHRVGGWVGLGGWLHTEVVCPLGDSHPS